MKEKYTLKNWQQFEKLQLNENQQKLLKGGDVVIIEEDVIT